MTPDPATDRPVHPFHGWFHGWLFMLTCSWFPSWSNSGKCNLTNSLPVRHFAGVRRHTGTQAAALAGGISA
eukprot:CAMPEP_0114492212 /NCGR_PEP_ID=MMETSP0109-20121206/3427_1 /TAXON_ID=29199 /ORGANISM="Chlorarachnion reptans, Strain CCCM449" /LENGTH=70 /DNA_ID=CAMNT_0001669025 /DNA_START=447 /DNA_END=655 /DNA_ORIENTATION=+